MWTIVVEAAGIFGAVGVRLGPSPAFSHGFDDSEPAAIALFQAQFAVPGTENVLELGWTDGRREIDRDVEIAVDIFCDHLADALEMLREGKPLRHPAKGAGPTA